MGLNQSNFERPSEKHSATLWYFAGRGRADQIRWVLAATEVSFAQRTLQSRDQMVKMAERQLPFGQIPLLQVDELEIVQSQAAVRYLAKRANIHGKNAEEEVKCDMIAEAVRDMLPYVLSAPFKKYKGLANGNKINLAEWIPHLEQTKMKWEFLASRFEAILESNLPPLPETKDKNGKSYAQCRREQAESVADGGATIFLVGDSLTYADILVAHIATWMVEECGVEVIGNFPLLTALQNHIITLPGIQKFIRGPCYYPLGDAAYVENVETVLGRN